MYFLKFLLLVRFGHAVSTECAPGQYKTAIGSINCQNCAANSNTTMGSTAASMCVCNPGFSGPNGGVCTPCAAGKYRDHDFMHLVSLDPPHIASTANDWNEVTNSFDSLCGGLACAGNTGYLQGPQLSIFALLLKNTPNPTFANEENRGVPMRWGLGTFPQFVADGGPNGNGHVTFVDSVAIATPLDTEKLNVKTNGGVTLVAIFRFTTKIAWAQVLSFRDHKIEDNQWASIMVGGSTNNWDLRIGTCRFVSGWTVEVDIWTTAVLRYETSTNTITFWLRGGLYRTHVCPANTVVRDMFAQGRVGMGIDMAGAFVVDALLTDAQVVLIQNSMRAGDDLLQAGHPRLATATKGTVTGNGAAGAVAFVGGNINTKMQWGPLSVPLAFTICSVTRYSGANKMQILGCNGNTLGNANFIHGHVGGIAGATLYGLGRDSTNLNPTSISPNTNWIVACGRNTITANTVSVLVNEVERSSAMDGVGACALGINQDASARSDWQLSKLYIWDYHLSDEKFDMASSFLNAELFSGRKSGECFACALNSNSPISSAKCKCNAGYKGADGGICLQCPAGTYKSRTGHSNCLACPTDSVSPVASTTSTACVCNAGWHGANGAICVACVAGTYKSHTGHSNCLACPKDSVSPVASTTITACVCNAGWHGANGAICVACVAGTYKSQPGNSACVSCPTYSNSPEASDELMDCVCLSGTTGPRGGVCVKCAGGKYRIAT